MFNTFGDISLFPVAAADYTDGDNMDVNDTMRPMRMSPILIHTFRFSNGAVHNRFLIQTVYKYLGGICTHFITIFMVRSSYLITLQAIHEKLL